MKILSILFLAFLFSVQTYGQETVSTRAHWDEEKGLLTYSLEEGSFVKIRVGKEGKAVYRTLVNVRERPGGTNYENWDGLDEHGKIKLTDYGKLHFCVSTASPSEDKDLTLKADISKDEVTIDLDKKDKALFMKEPAELKVYLGEQIILAERVSSLPYRFNLTHQDFSEGRRLLCMNLWRRPEFKSCAYQTIEISNPSRSDSAIGLDKKYALSGKIVFCQLYKGYWQVWRGGLNGRRLKVLTNSPIDKRYPCLSPSGDRVAYVTNTGELWITNSDGSNNQKIPLPINCYEPKWSADAKRIVFTSYEDLFHSNSKIWILNLETNALNKIANRPFLQYNPNWSPDEKNVIFVDGPELYAQEIRKLDLNTGDVTQITDSSMFVYETQPSYLPDGEGIIYSSNQDGDYNIWIIDKIGSTPKNLTPGSSHDTSGIVSSDGQKIFFLSDRTGINEIWQMDIDGKHLTQLTRTGKDKRDISVWTK